MDTKKVRLSFPIITAPPPQWSTSEWDDRRNPTIGLVLDTAVTYQVAVPAANHSDGGILSGIQVILQQEGEDGGKEERVLHLERGNLSKNENHLPFILVRDGVRISGKLYLSIICTDLRMGGGWLSFSLTFKGRWRNDEDFVEVTEAFSIQVPTT